MLSGSSAAEADGLRVAAALAIVSAGRAVAALAGAAVMAAAPVAGRVSVRAGGWVTSASNGDGEVNGLAEVAAAG